MNAKAVLWRTVRCRRAECGTVFSLCGSCYRGQTYCEDHCRATAQRHQRRHATARHQRSLEGRLDHRDRQRAYRARRRLRCVTDAPSPGPPRSTTIALPVGPSALRLTVPGQERAAFNKLTMPLVTRPLAAGFRAFRPSHFAIALRKSVRRRRRTVGGRPSRLNGGSSMSSTACSTRSSAWRFSHGTIATRR